MNCASGFTVLSLALGLSLAQVACGDAQADKKQVIETATEAPAQPTKPVSKTDDEWKKELTEEQYYILRKHGTERAWGKAYDEFKKQGEGTYYCAGCNAELFTSKEKFDARCGWPAFFDVSKHKNIKTLEDRSFGSVRVEVRCAVCDGHLGHVFEGEGFNTPTDQRYCINGTVLKFVPKIEGEGDKEKDQATGDKPAPEKKPDAEKE